MSRCAAITLAVFLVSFAVSAQSIDDTPPTSNVIRKQFSSARLLELLNATHQGKPRALPADEPVRVETWYPDRISFQDNGQFQIDGVVRVPEGLPGDESEIRFYASGTFEVAHASKQTGLRFRLKGQVNIHLEVECVEASNCNESMKNLERPLATKLQIRKGKGPNEFVLRTQRRAKDGFLFNQSVVELHPESAQPEE